MIIKRAGYTTFFRTHITVFPEVMENHHLLDSAAIELDRARQKVESYTPILARKVDPLYDHGGFIPVIIFVEPKHDREGGLCRQEWGGVIRRL